MAAALNACGRGRAISARSAELGDARTAFLATPASVPQIVEEVGAEFPRHPPTPRFTPLLAAAAWSGYAAATFDQASAEAPSAQGPPDEATRAALRNLARTQSALSSGAPPAQGAAQEGGDAVAATAWLLPSMAAASEEGLARDRINLLVEATRNASEAIRALAPAVLASDGRAVLAYSRDNVVQEDATWGGHRRARLSVAQARAEAALRALAPADRLAVSRWYAGPGGRAEAARASLILARAYDAASATMTKEYYRRLQSDQTRASPTP